MHVMKRQSKRKNLQNSESPLSFSLVILVFAHVIISSITALNMFSDLCLVLLLLLAGPTVQKFDFQLTKIS